MRRAGVRRDSSVVAYDDSDASSAARAWWLLRYFGHDAVAVLNGGWRAWTSGDHPVSVEAAEPREGDFVARPGAMPIVDAEGAARLADKRLLIDVRVGPRFRGEMEPVDPIAGHIPGAVNLPAAENVNEDGLFRSAADLRERFAAFTGAEGVGVSCGSGVVATQTVLAMELAGIRASLYPGSWSGWITDLSRPLAVGAED